MPTWRPPQLGRVLGTRRLTLSGALRHRAIALFETLRLGGAHTKPARWAMAAASPRLATPSLARMFETCTDAVFGEITSVVAITGFDAPSATSGARPTPPGAGPE